MSVPATTTPAQTPAKAPPRSVLVSVATRYAMEPAAFEATLRGTVFPTTGTREEFAAFLVVANEYRLNPITRQIYAFPKKGGGIVPVVGIDGWIHLVNTHSQFDGMEFEFENDDQGRLISCTCRMYRKDRSKPVVVTEYLEECVRQTEPWRMKRRMLRHKAMIQSARYAFGFSGIHDEDEARDIADSIDAPVPPAPPPPPVEMKAAPAPQVEDAQIIDRSDDPGTDEDADAVVEQFNAEAWLRDDVAGVFECCKTEKNVDEAHDMFSDTVETMLGMDHRSRYQELHEAALTRVTDAAKTAAAPETGAAAVEEEAPAPSAPPPAAATRPQDTAPPAGPSLDDEEDEPAAPEPPPASPGDAYKARLTAAISNPDRTAAGLKLWWDDNKADRVALKKAGHITQDDVVEMHAKLTAAYNDAFAKEQEEAGQLRDDGTDPQKSEPLSNDPIAAFDREYRAKIAGITSVTELHAYVESTLKTRNGLGVDQAQVTEWRKVKTQRQNELNGIA